MAFSNRLKLVYRFQPSRTLDLGRITTVISVGVMDTYNKKRAPQKSIPPPRKRAADEAFSFHDLPYD